MPAGRSWKQFPGAATAPFRLVLRARIILLAACGLANRVIASRLGVCEDTARKWRRRYCEQGPCGLADAPRPGRPRKLPARVLAEVKALACELPVGSGKPLARWTCPELAREAAASGVVAAVSPSTVRRWLADDAIKPWQHRSWIFPATRTLPSRAAASSTCTSGPGKERPWARTSTFSALMRSPASRPARASLPLPPGPRRAMRAESEYVRCGTLAYLAAYDVHRATVSGRCEPSTGTKPFTALVDQVMSSEPYASAKRVFWVVDNGASHRNWATAARLRDAYPNAQMVHLPVHASWLNRVEVYFSVIQRKLLTPDDFGDLDSLAEQILAFEKHYNATARPFDWRFTRTDLNQLLTRLGRHDPFAPRALAA